MVTLNTAQRRTFASYLTGEEFAYTSTLMAILGWLYGTEFLSSSDGGGPWTPQTLRLQLAEDAGIEVDDKIMDRIQAGVIALTDDRVFEDAVIFHHVVSAMWDDEVMPDEWDDVEPEEVAWGFSELMLLRGEQDPRVVIGDDVEAYARVVMQQDGFTVAPKKLWWVALPKLSDEDYSDDPNMFASIYRDQQRKAAEVDEFVDQHLGELLEQLNGLPLGDKWFDPNRLFDGAAARARE